MAQEQRGQLKLAAALRPRSSTLRDPSQREEEGCNQPRTMSKPGHAGAPCRCGIGPRRSGRMPPHAACGVFGPTSAELKAPHRQARP